jgi:hypothetical protein
MRHDDPSQVASAAQSADPNLWITHRSLFD